MNYDDDGGTLEQEAKNVNKCKYQGEKMNTNCEVNIKKKIANQDKIVLEFWKYRLGLVAQW